MFAFVNARRETEPAPRCKVVPALPLVEVLAIYVGEFLSHFTHPRTAERDAAALALEATGAATIELTGRATL